MSSIGGPGGVGGPKSPGGASRADAADTPDALDGAGTAREVGGVAPDPGVSAAGAASTGDLDAIAADLAAGKLTPQEAVDKLVEQIASGGDLAPAERAELRELMADLVASDPHLGGLISRL